MKTSKWVKIANGSAWNDLIDCGLALKFLWVYYLTQRPLTCCKEPYTIGFNLGSLPNSIHHYTLTVLLRGLRSIGQHTFSKAAKPLSLVSLGDYQQQPT